MADRLVERTLRAFSDDLASDAPVPGGGSASAFAGAMGAGLVAMVTHIAARKSDDAELPALIREVEFLRSAMLTLVDDDSAAYAQVAQAMRLPRMTDDEKRERSARIQAALARAAYVPLELAKASRALLDACERGLPRAPAAAISDIGVGALLAEAALRGAAMNVMINLASLKDADEVKALSEELDQVVDGAAAQTKRITDFVESRIAR